MFSHETSIEFPRLTFNKSEKFRILRKSGDEHVQFNYARFSVPIPPNIFMKNLRDDLELMSFNVSGAFERQESYSEVTKFTYDVTLLRREQVSYPLNFLKQITHIEVTFDSCCKLSAILESASNTLRILECHPQTCFTNDDLIPLASLMSSLSLLIINDGITPEAIPTLLDHLDDTKIKLRWHPGPSREVVQKSSFRIAGGIIKDAGDKFYSMLPANLPIGTCIHSRLRGSKEPTVYASLLRFYQIRERSIGKDSFPRYLITTPRDSTGSAWLTSSKF